MLLTVPSKICHLPAAAASLTDSLERRILLAAIAFNSSAETVAVVTLSFLSSVLPVAVALNILVFLSYSIAISTVDSLAPDFITCSNASCRIDFISLSVGFTTVRSTTSRTIAIATPIVEIIGAFFTIFH